MFNEPTLDQQGRGWVAVRYPVFTPASSFPASHALTRNYLHVLGCLGP